MVGDGGAPPTTQVTAWSSFAASGCASRRDQHGGRGAQVRCTGAQLAPERGGLGPGHDDVRGADTGDSPAEAPAVAVEHGQRPEIVVGRPELRLDETRERAEVGAAVRVDDALRRAGRPARVVDGDRPVLAVGPVGRHRLRAGEQFLVLGPEPHDVQSGQLDRLARRGLELGVEQQHLRTAVLDDEAHLGRGQAGVDGAQGAARGGHAEMRLEQLEPVEREHRDARLGLDAQRAERRAQPPRALCELRERDRALAVAHRRPVGICQSAAPQQRERRELVAIRLGHSSSSRLRGGSSTSSHSTSSRRIARVEPPISSSTSSSAIVGSSSGPSSTSSCSAVWLRCGSG